MSRWVISTSRKTCLLLTAHQFFLITRLRLEHLLHFSLIKFKIRLLVVGCWSSKAILRGLAGKWQLAIAKQVSTKRYQKWHTASSHNSVWAARILQWSMFFKDVPFLPYFSLFLPFHRLNEQLVDKVLPMSGFELRIPGVGSDPSTNWATTTAQVLNVKLSVA